MTDPGRANSNSRVRWGTQTGADPAKYLIDPGSVDINDAGQIKISAGMLAHARPYILAGDQLFVFPIGVEGFRRSGAATLGLHKYLGDNAVDGITTHFEEARISLEGTFPGLTAQPSMIDCINVLRAQHPIRGLSLFCPGVFNMEQYVLAENWEFSHEPDDRTHSIAYTISFVRLGEGGQADDPAGTPPPAQPGQDNGVSKGKPANVFTVADNARTLKAIAQKVYGDANKWAKLVDLNAGQLADWQRGNAMNALYNLPTYQLPTYRWPIGTKFRY